MTVYLTYFRINPDRRAARHLLTSPQALHAAVLGGFADPADHTRDNVRTLWRLDHNARHDIVLYIASPGEPDLTHLVEQIGWPTTSTWQTRPYQPLLDTLANGQTWAFRLTANTVRSGRKNADATQTQRFGAVTATQQRDWLTSRAGRNGFTISHQDNGELNLIINQRATNEFRRANTPRPVTLVTATYDGVLQITDADTFRRTLTNGIGHGRAYGCGLITLATPHKDTAHTNRDRDGTVHEHFSHKDTR